MSYKLDDRLRRGVISNAVMAELDWPGGTRRFWSGLGLLDYAGETYLGLGQLGTVTPLQTSVDVEVDQITFMLSGVDPDLLAGLDGSVKGYEARVYEVFLDDDHAVVDRELLFDCRQDYQTIQVGEDGRATLALVATGGFFHLLNRSAAKWSAEEQKALYPDDTGFDEMHLQASATLTWHP